jgi:hypothetical protein
MIIDRNMADVTLVFLICFIADLFENIHGIV